MINSGAAAPGLREKFSFSSLLNTMEEHTLFYGFSANPFKITPDVRFFFLGQNNREALASIIYGINERKGFILITGEAGTGKTALVHYLSHKLAGKVPAVIIDQAETTFEQLLAKIFLQLGLTSEGQKKGARIRQLNMDLILRHARGQNFVLLIDEAHDLSEEVMDELRLLSNLETRHSKLIQIVLLGQPEIRIKLNSKNLKQFNQRIVIKGRMGRLTEQESRQYIDHRLTLVGSGSSEVFTPQALSLICRRARGVPGRINFICDHAFSFGYQHSAKRIDWPIAKEALNHTCQPRRTLSPARVFGEALSRRTAHSLNKTLDRAYRQRQRLSRAWAHGESYLLGGIAHYSGKALGLAYRSRRNLSSARAFGEALFGGTAHSVKKTIGWVYQQRPRLSRFWVKGDLLLLTEIPSSAKKALNRAYQQGRRLSRVSSSGTFSAGKLSSWAKQALDRAYRPKQRIVRAWSHGETFLTGKISYFTLAVLCSLIGILFPREPIMTISEKATALPPSEHRVVTGKVSVPMLPKEVNSVSGDSPPPALKKIEPIPSAEHPTAGGKRSGRAARSKRKVPAGKNQVQLSPRRNPAPRRTIAPKASPPVKGTQIEAAPRNSPTISSGGKGVISLPVRPVAREKEEPHKTGLRVRGPEGPAIIQSFAPKRIRPGDLYKVYLQASDRNGDMKYILCLMENDGSRLSIIKIKEENREHFSGYLFFNTSKENSRPNHTDLTLSIWIKDSAGHLSQPARFSLSFQPDIIPQRPPQNLFQEISLGPILTPLPNSLDTGG